MKRWKDCTVCGERFWKGPRMKWAEFNARRYCSRPCVHAAAEFPAQAREARAQDMDEAWEERRELIMDGLYSLGLTPEGVASDCGVALPSLVRQCERRGEAALAATLRKGVGQAPHRRKEAA